MGSTGKGLCLSGKKTDYPYLLNNSKVNLQPTEVNFPFSLPMKIPASKIWVAKP